MHAFVFWKLKDREKRGEKEAEMEGRRKRKRWKEEGRRREGKAWRERKHQILSVKIIGSNQQKLLNKEEDEASGQLAAALTKLEGLLGGQVGAWEASAPSQFRAASLLVCWAPATVPGIQTQSVAGTAVSAVLGNQPLLPPPLPRLLPQSILPSPSLLTQRSG